MKNQDKRVTIRMRLGAIELLTMLFITLKLTGLVSWSWWVVLSPLWFAAFLVLLMFIVAVVYVALGD